MVPFISPKMVLPSESSTLASETVSTKDRCQTKTAAQPALLSCPDQVLAEIIQRLHPLVYGRLKQVCKRLRYVCDSDTTWQALCKSYGYIRKDPSTSYKRLWLNHEYVVNGNLIWNELVELANWKHIQQKSVVHKAQFLLLGDKAVGKSCLSGRFVRENFIMVDRHVPTNYVDFKVKSIPVSESYEIRAFIWEGGTLSQINNINTGKSLAIICYDVTSRSSFENVLRWFGDAEKQETECAMLVGCKSDLKTRAVSFEEGANLAMGLNVRYIETSAKENRSVDEAFWYAISLSLKEVPTPRKFAKPLVFDSSSERQASSKKKCNIM
eukprot:TRINITY_DN7132_c0_g1_i1.p1 TRINITY_DN7132_c0_g1~~TRINITY_DN7132_c0_g1_i1.p1  ORF type:complete len:325 (-),score=22.39 TRINITY_DN7132_c0_g1_i1:30-1004(-)